MTTNQPQSINAIIRKHAQMIICAPGAHAASENRVVRTLKHCLKLMVNDNVTMRVIYEDLAEGVAAMPEHRGDIIYPAVENFSLLWRELKSTYGIDDLVKKIESL